ncbi:hypothetical protein BC938DRAFT_479844, partial [Jimgerdemannia flammicorona]
MVIVQESGGLVLHGSVPSPDPVNIFCRKYLAVRASPGLDARERQMGVAGEMWDLVEDIEAPRESVPGGFEA